MTLEVTVSNVGGIETMETTFEEGVTLIAAPNASNKTSLLKAIAFGLGADDVPIRSGATEATVTLTLDGRTVTRTARRQGVGTQITGDSWLDAEATATFETVASLLEFNPLRTAVRQAEDIENALKSPIDFESLEQQRTQLLEEKRSKSRELEGFDDLDTRLAETETELENAKQRRTELKAELEELEAAHEPAAVDEELEQLQERRTELLAEKNETLEQIDALKDAIDRFEDERADIEERIEELEVELAETDVERLRQERDQLQRDLDELVDKIDILQSVLTANREMVNSEYTSLFADEHGLMEDQVSCWTCGEQVTVADIRNQLTDLQSIVESEKAKKSGHEPAISDLEAEIAEAQTIETELDRLRRKQRQIADRIDDRESSLAIQSDRLDELESELSTVTEDLEAARKETTEQADELMSSIEEVRVETQTVEREIQRLKDKRDELHTDQERRATLEDELDDLSGQIASITDRLETMEQRLREQFNDAMDDLLGTLDFDGIDRIWLDGEFELIVARTVDSSIQRDSVRNLAESERELVGLVLGLAGYEAYELNGEVPVLLLDSLGALDNTRIGRLVEYIEGVPDYLIAAGHPDTATSIESDDICVRQAPLPGQ